MPRRKQFKVTKAAERRALTKVLKEYGDRKMVDAFGKETTYAKETARLLWDLATQGKAEFKSGEALKASTRDWRDTVGFIFNQVDGPAKTEQEIELTGTQAALSGMDTKALIAMVQDVNIEKLGIGVLPGQEDDENDVDAEEVEALPEGETNEG